MGNDQVFLKYLKNSKDILA